MKAALLIASMLTGGDDNLKRDMRALELFLQDQEDHRTYCPKKRWSQPDIEVYKKSLRSHLPKGCKK
jgi:hypothetical protein|tara:strand:- start:263 stop:463 length:201 start_codon:yes stop_codon:yes gene_type:complete